MQGYSQIVKELNTYFQNTTHMFLDYISDMYSSKYDNEEYDDDYSECHDRDDDYSSECDKYDDVNNECDKYDDVNNECDKYDDVNNKCDNQTDKQ
jgi:uncharacterized protein (UPF0305 family)